MMRIIRCATRLISIFKLLFKILEGIDTLEQEQTSPLLNESVRDLSTSIFIFGSNNIIVSK